MRRESCEGSPSDRRRIGCASTLVLSTRQTPLFVYFARQVQDCGRGASRYTARSVQSENRRLIVRKDVNPLIDGRGSRRSFKGSTLSLICGSAISSIWLSPCLFVCGRGRAGGCRKVVVTLCAEALSRHTRKQGWRKEDLCQELSFLLSKILNSMCYVIQHNTGPGEKGVESHVTRLFSPAHKNPCTLSRACDQPLAQFRAYSPRWRFSALEERAAVIVHGCCGTHSQSRKATP